MRYRRKMNTRKSRKLFKKTANRTRSVNNDRRVVLKRGGYRM